MSYESHLKEFLHSIGTKPVEMAGKESWTTCSCPLAPFTHRNGRDSNPSFGIKQREGKLIYNCFSCGSGTVDGLVQTLEYYTQKNPNFAHLYDLKRARFLLHNTDFASIELEPFDSIQPVHEVIEWDENFLLKFPKAYDLKEPREYLQSRGVTERESNFYNIRYDLDRQLVCFPLYDVYGRFCGLRGRGVTKEAMKHYDYDYRGINNSDSVFFNEPVIATLHPVIVVEGQFDLINVARVYPYTVANLTSSFSGLKGEKLLQADGVMLMLDNDDTGRRKAEKLHEKLEKGGQEVVTVFIGEDGQDPDNCSLEEIYTVLSEYIPEKYLKSPIDKTI